MKENLSGKKGRREEGWGNGRKEKRIWEPRQPKEENKNIEKEGEVKGLVCCRRWLSKRDNKEGKEDSCKPSQHSEPWVILLL